MNIIDEINRWWPLLSIAATAGCGWCLWQPSRRFVSRVETLERHMESVPGNSAMHSIELSLTELRGDMKELRGHMDGMETSMTGLKAEIAMLIEHHLENR